MSNLSLTRVESLTQVITTLGDWVTDNIEQTVSIVKRPREYNLYNVGLHLTLILYCAGCISVLRLKGGAGQGFYKGGFKYC